MTYPVGSVKQNPDTLAVALCTTHADGLSRRSRRSRTLPRGHPAADRGAAWGW